MNAITSSRIVVSRRRS